MKTWTTTIEVSHDEEERQSFYTLTSPKTGKKLTISEWFVPTHLLDVLNSGVFFVGKGTVELTLGDFQAWLDAFRAYQEVECEREDRETEPYEVRFGPRDDGGF